MNALAKFTLDAAMSYVQSVVFVDDEIYDQDDRVKEVPVVDLPTVPDQFTSSSDGNTTTLTHIHSSDPPGIDDSTNNRFDGFSSKQLTDSFAEKGIVCGLFEPHKDPSTAVDSTLFKVCQRADIVILDWDIDNDHGKIASSLISNLITEISKTNPNQIGLLVIYTLTPGLSGVKDRLKTALEKEGHAVTPIDGTAISVSAFRVRVLGKPGATGRLPEEMEWEVAENEIATRIITEFATIYRGLLPSFALHGMASIRKNTRRILDKFNPSMDGAYLLHRALTLSSEDAFHQIPELLSDEIRAVVEDEHPSSNDLQQLANAASDDVVLKSPAPSWKAKGGKGEDVDCGPIMRRFLSLGEDGIIADGTRCKEASKILEKPKSMLPELKAIVSHGSVDSNERLASLFSSRSQYGNTRTLTFGTVVRFTLIEDLAFEQFALCLMPICDSIRLKGDETKFPFWTLKEGVSPSAPNGAGLVIELGNERTETFTTSGKISNHLWFDEFNVNKETRTVSASESKDTFLFKSKAYKVEWVGQLKSLHAQRIAQDVAQAFSRVGLNEAEWLRLLCG